MAREVPLTARIIRDREELAKLIMKAAIEKVEALGFTMKVGSNQCRHILVLDRINFLHPERR